MSRRGRGGRKLCVVVRDASFRDKDFCFLISLLRVG